MEEHDPHRRAAQYRLDRLAEQDGREAEPRTDDEALADDDARTDGGRGAVPGLPRPPSMAARGSFADELVRQAMARGEFDDLPLTGKPIPGITGRHDPDWWLKALIEREQITGVLPEALQLRKDDAALDDRLDGERTEDRVRELVEELNARIVAARRQLLGGPPVVTPLRDVEAEVARWHERHRARQTAAASAEAERRSLDAARADDAARARSWARVVERLRRPGRARDGSSSGGRR